MYGYCQEKIDLGHYWDLKGYKEGVVVVDIDPHGTSYVQLRRFQLFKSPSSHFVLNR